MTILSRGKLIAQGGVQELLRSRGREQVRMKTTDDAKAREILSALEWVEEVTEEEGSLLVSAPLERTAELSAALGRSWPLRGLRQGGITRSDVSRGLLPGGDGR